MAYDMDGLPDRLSDLFRGHAAEVPQFNKVRERLILERERLESAIQIQYVDRVGRRVRVSGQSGGPHAAAPISRPVALALLGGAGAPVVHENLPHHPRRESQKMNPVREITPPVLTQLQIRLMNQGGGFESVTVAFPPQLPGGHAA